MIKIEKVRIEMGVVTQFHESIVSTLLFYFYLAATTRARALLKQLRWRKMSINRRYPTLCRHEKVKKKKLKPFSSACWLSIYWSIISKSLFILIHLYDIVFYRQSNWLPAFSISFVLAYSSFLFYSYQNIFNMKGDRRRNSRFMWSER